MTIPSSPQETEKSHAAPDGWIPSEHPDIKLDWTVRHMMNPLIIGDDYAFIRELQALMLKYRYSKIEAWFDPSKF